MKSCHQRLLLLWASPEVMSQCCEVPGLGTGAVGMPLGRQAGSCVA